MCLREKSKTNCEGDEHLTVPYTSRTIGDGCRPWV